MARPAVTPGRGPSATLPLRYLLTAAGALPPAAIGAVWLAPELTGHYYHPRLFALTHTLTLGWITVTIIGASYQLLPVVLERPLWSERLARWQFGLLVAGVAAMIAQFLLGDLTRIAWSAGLVTLATGTHVANVALTLRGLPRWTFTARMVALAHVGLVLTALSGLLLGADRAWKILPGGALENLHAHVHLALLGWVLPMVVGVAARVYPMFLLASEPTGGLGSLQLWGLALGVPAVVTGLATGSAPVTIGGALAVAAAIAGHLVWMGAIVRTRQRPALDWPLRLVLTGTAFLVPSTVVGLGLTFDLLAGPRIAIGYAILALGGWASLTIAGMMLKIVPFLVWYRVYAPLAGRAPVPMLAALSSTRAEAVASLCLTVGTAALALAVANGDVTLVRAAAALLTTGALAFALALARVTIHLVHPVSTGTDTAPLARETPA